MTATPDTTPAPARLLFERGPRDYFAILWRRKVLVLAILVLLPVATYLIVSREQKNYVASALVSVQPSDVDLTLLSDTSSAPTTGAIERTARLIQTTAVGDVAAQFLSGPRQSPRKLVASISVEADPIADFVTITGHASSAARSAEIANAFARATVQVRTSAARQTVGRAIAQAQQELRALPPSDISRRQLSQQIQRLRVIRASQGENAQIVEDAVPPSSPASPHPTRLTALALVLAVIAAISLALFLERFDRRLRNPEELDELTGGMPLLSEVPDSAFTEGALPHEARESFMMLGTTLMYFNVDESLDVVLVTSPGSGDGKTTVASNLALAVAATGKNVILVDADLRRGSASARFAPDDVKRGLSDVLSDQASLQEVLVSIGPDHAECRFLPAGPTPPNPRSLLGSDRMREVIRELAAEAQLVIVDTTPVVALSDAIPLLNAVSGVVLVARMDYTHKNAFTKAQRIVAQAQGNLLGAVATGAKPRQTYGYGYRYGYGYGYGYGSDLPASESNGSGAAKHLTGS
jgi:capsular exopolysaccharide synthesis family protein